MGAPQTNGTKDGELPLTNDKSGTDSEWEYEYDEELTEDFYFTLDLPPSNGPPAKRRKKNTQKAAENEAVDPALGPTRSQYVTNGSTGQHQRDQDQQREPLIFTDLHTTTPSVEYGEERYDCRWTTDLGTQFHVTRSGVVKDPHRAGHVADVVALSRVRLTGRHAGTPPPARTNKTTGTSAGHAIVLDDEEDEYDDGDGGSGPKPKIDDSQPRLSFLERVAEIQRRKKEAATNATDGPSSNANLPAQRTASSSLKDDSASGLIANQQGQAAESADLSSRPSRHAQPLSMDGPDGQSVTDHQELPQAQIQLVEPVQGEGTAEEPA